MKATGAGICAGNNMRKFSVCAFPSATPYAAEHSGKVKQSAIACIHTRLCSVESRSLLQMQRTCSHLNDSCAVEQGQLGQDPAERLGTCPGMYHDGTVTQLELQSAVEADASSRFAFLQCCPRCAALSGS